MITVEGLCKRFVLHQRGGIVLDVLRDVSFGVASGECVALTGPSGRGKSTVLKCLDGNYAIDAGSVRLAPHGEVVELATASPRRIHALRRTGVARVSQFLRAVPRVPALDVVAERWLDDGSSTTAPGDEAGWAAREREARDRAAEWLARVRLPSAVWNLPPATFSGGEQQRVNIARALVRPVPVLLLDEPTASLDSANRDVVVALLRAARDAGAAVVGIFHDPAVRSALASRCIPIGAEA